MGLLFLLDFPRVGCTPLGYIGSLLLRTLPAINADRGADIKVPAAPKKDSIPDPNPSQKPL